MLVFPSLVVSLAGLLYPAYCSSKALQEKDLETSTQWLAYWIVYTTFTVVEGPFYGMLSMFPFYAELKLCFVLWLQLPYFQGATWLYHVYLGPLFDEATRSAVFEKLSAAVSQVLKNGISAEQIRQATEYVKGKVATLQKKPAVPPVVGVPVAEEPVVEGVKKRPPKAE